MLGRRVTGQRPWHRPACNVKTEVVMRMNGHRAFALRA